MRIRERSRSRRLLVVIAAVAAMLCVAPGIAHAVPTSIASPFPRLGLVWPNPYTQDVQSIAKSDYVAMLPQYLGKSAEIRAIRPDIMILGATNACELPLDPSRDETYNESAKPVPNAWIQTQLGSTLKHSVSATATTLYVSPSQASRFKAKDILVFGSEPNGVASNELAVVTAVNVSTGTLRVTRGVVGERASAAAHAAGVRVAAAAIFWPGNVVMDLSDYCPKVTVDSAAGPETWASYNARMGAAIGNLPSCDGLHIDRSNSKAYINTVWTRSIDPRRNNVAVTDGYVDYNAKWDSGLRRYVAGVRSKMGSRIILANNGAGNINDLLNGTVLENFPTRSSALTASRWGLKILGPGTTSYAEFMRKSRQPNLTTLETYEVVASPIAGTAPRNPFGDAGWHPDYRKMRFGLTSALMNNGFFNYNIGTFGHATLGLMWFDEFDDAGAGQGYLGAATSAARNAMPPVTSSDLLRYDGKFSTLTQFKRWTPWAAPGYKLSASRYGSCAKLVVSRSGGKSYGATYAHHRVAVSKNAYYTVTFRARATSTVQVAADLRKATSPYTTYARFGAATVGTSWKTYTLVTKATGSTSSGSLILSVGGKRATIYIDDVKVQKGWRPSVFRRDFSKGIAIVNPESVTITVPLGGTYRKINGTQDRSVNNGATVRSVTVGPQDGVVLLRP